MQLQNQKGETYISAYQFFQTQVDSTGYTIKQFQCENGLGEQNIKNFQFDLMTCSTTCKPCLLYVHHEDGVAEHVMHTVTDMAWAMMIDVQTSMQFKGDEVNATVYLHERLPNDGMITNDSDWY